MQSNQNRVIIACAGSGKTTTLVEDALSMSNRRIGIVTYTNNNTREIVERFGERNGGVPDHVEVATWFGFLLREGARPYQRARYKGSRIESLLFTNTQSTRGIQETDTTRYYFANRNMIYSDKIARFVVECEAASGNRVTARLRHIYTDIFIDEFQDLSGWDFDLVEMLLQSGIRVTLVGDPRQHIYSTSPAQKNKKYLGVGVVNLIQTWEARGLCAVLPRNGSYRCNHSICDFANRLWPGMDGMKSLTKVCTEHHGVFLVSESAVHDYVRCYTPQILRYNTGANTYGYTALNFGLAKGLEFDRVLIIPTDPIKKYLGTGTISHVERSRDKLYVAITRARHSVAFVYDGLSPIVSARWPET